VNPQVRRASATTRRRTAQRAKTEALTAFRTASILAAASTVFARHGFDATTVDLIAQEAGVAKGTLYLYYPSKAAIYSAAVIAGLQELAAQTVASLSADIPLREKVRRLLEMRLRYFEERADFFRIYNAELGTLGQAAVDIRREHRRLFDMQVDRLASEFDAAMAKRRVRRINARQIALFVLDLSHGLVQRRLDGDVARADEDVDEVLGVLWKGIQKT
jgi:AcrR family transcriptional regulator